MTSLILAEGGGVAYVIIAGLIVWMIRVGVRGTKSGTPPAQAPGDESWGAADFG